MILSQLTTKAPASANKKVFKEKLQVLHKKLYALQNVLYAEGKHPILIILQGMDTSGKDGTIRQVFSCVNPMGCNVKSFRKPTALELQHDFMWRIYSHLPAKGMMQIFNRSHYEDILMPTINRTLPEVLIKERYDFINCFEQQLKSSGTIILKFFLHISKSEQENRIESRKNSPHKKWKYDKSDTVAASKWAAYQAIYQTILNQPNPAIPWVIIPADQRWYRNYLVAKIMIETLEKLEMKYPK